MPDPDGPDDVPIPVHEPDPTGPDPIIDPTIPPIKAFAVLTPD
jgi:hypothetical protein